MLWRFVYFSSAEYEEKAQICRLSREDRRTQPMAFRRDGGLWDYLENQCVRSMISTLRLIEYSVKIMRCFLKLCLIAATPCVLKEAWLFPWIKWNLHRAKENANLYAIRYVYCSKSYVNN